jgi:F-type H+-transporting ATPase subunit epsilon
VASQKKDTMFLEIITPEVKLFEGEVSSVTFPGQSGSFQVLKDHAPIISMLGEGDIKMHLADATRTFDPQSGRVVLDKSDDEILHIAIKRGVIEMNDNNIIVLVD